MKRFLSFLLLFCVFICAMSSCVSNDGDTAGTTAATAENAATTAITTTATTIAETPAEPTPIVYNDEELYVGYARENISPKNPDGTLMDLALPSSVEERACQILGTELYASCTAFKDSEGRIALFYSVDTTNFAGDVTTNFRNRISEATGVMTRMIVLNATHTHTAPELHSEKHPQTNTYKNMIGDALVRAAQAAIEDLTLCDALYVGQIDASGLSFIRRYVTDENGNLAHESEPDQHMPVARFVREGKKDVIIANWAAHTDTLSAAKKKITVSADYYEYFRRYVESKIDAYISIHMAASGDVNAVSKIPGEYEFPGTTGYGRALGVRLVEQIESLERIEIKSKILATASTLSLEVDHSTDYLLARAEEVKRLYSTDQAAFEAKCREYGFATIHEANSIISRAALGATQSCTVWAISIGNIAFAVVPYEMFAHNGKNIKSASEFDLTFVCAYSNGSYGYIASDYAYENGEYEVYKCRYVKGTAEILQDKIIEMIAQLYNK